MTIPRKVVAAGVIAMCMLPGLSPAQQAGPELDVMKSVRMVRTDTPPVIDGRMDDAVWARAAVIDDFHQSQPIEGAEPTERTVIYLLYDDDALYIGGRFWDSEPDLIAAGTLRHRSLRLGDDDRIAVVLSPYNDRRSGYKFETNANGVKHESIYQNVSQNLSVWDTIWDVASTTGSDGWITEIAIPLKSISFDPENDTWGINFSRAVRRKGEEITWVSRNRSYNPSIVGLATGLTGLQQGLGLDVVPAVALNRRRVFEPSGDTSMTRPSLDLFYKVTPSLNGALTLNTDFSATEVDSRQVNLTRFNLFFPERRAFFLQDTDIFEFGRIGGQGSNVNRSTSGSSRQNGRPFFSRRLGLSDSGQPVDLDYGGKLSGRVGPWSVGGLAVRQAQFGDVESSDVFAGRASLSMLGESALGIMVTEGDPNTNLGNSVAGADFRYLNSRMGNGRVLEADAWFLQSDTEGLSGDDRAFGLGLRAPESIRIAMGAGDQGNPEQFQPRVRLRQPGGDSGSDRGFRLRALFSKRADRVLRRTRLTLSASNSWTADCRRRSSRSARWRSGAGPGTGSASDIRRPMRSWFDRSAFTATPRARCVRSSSPRGVIHSENTWSRLPPAVTGNWPAAWTIARATSSAGNASTWQQTLTGGHRNTLRSGSAYDWNDIRLPQGAFVARLAQLTTEVAFNSDLSWINLVQYDNVTEEAGINSRLHWVLQDGREAYLVLNHNLQDYDRDNSFNESLSDLSLKVNYTFRF